MKRLGLSDPRLMIAVIILPTCGCQPGNQVLTVTGRLVENGTPLKASAEGLPPGIRPIQVVFHTVPREAQASGESFYSQVNAETGEFKAMGSSNRGIPPGKYRISVTVLVPAEFREGRLRPDMLGGPNPAGVLGMQDRLKGDFRPPRSPLEVEITKPSRLILDVGTQPGVTIE